MTLLDLAIRHFSKLTIIATIVLALGTVTHVANAKIDIGELGGQSTMAEQGAICASFSALMENQILINQNLGNLWSERRKFSGAVIRRAVELSGRPAPSADDIDILINDYREWLLLNLSNQNADQSSNDYQTDVRNLIQTNCASLFVQADKAIMKRFPNLAYLITEDGASFSDQSTEIDTLLAKNKELNLTIVSLVAEVAKLKEEIIKQPKTEQAAQTQIARTAQTSPSSAAPKPRPTPPKTQAAPAKSETSGRFFAQLGSFSSQDSATTALDEMQQNFAALFTNTNVMIKPHEFASGKIFYRLRTENGNRALITQICDKLWQARMGCLIKTNID